MVFNVIFLRYIILSFCLIYVDVIVLSKNIFCGVGILVKGYRSNC